MRKCFLAKAECCNSSSRGDREVQTCIAKADAPMQQTEQIIKMEIDDFQQRLQRAVMSCQDRLKDKLPSNATEVPPKLQAEFDSCATGVLKQHIGMIPALSKRVIANMKEIK